MTHSDLQDLYEKRKSLFGASLAETRKKINIISNIRLAVALSTAAVLYFGFSHHDLLYALAPLLVAFVLLVRRHTVFFDRKTHLENLKKIQQAELQALVGNCSNFASGSEFVNVHHPYSHDLDIFGDGSLFQYINRSNTPEGKMLLASWLSSTSASIEQVVRRQHAVEELSQLTDFRHEIQALSMEIHEQPEEHSQLLHWLTQPSFIYGRQPYRILLTLFPAVTVTLVIASFLIDGITGFAVLPAGMQWAFLGFHIRRVNQFHQHISRKKNTLEKYARILFAIRKQQYSSPLLQALRASAQEADQKVRHLASLVSNLDARLNSMTNLVVNSLLLYDLQCVYRLEKWKEENAARLPGWLDTAREAEALCSLGTFAFNHPGFTMPEIKSDQKLSANGMGHPLLNADERVVNDMVLDGERQIMIITGANMAGKSTFLRTVGVNVVLALSGAPVCAREFHCPLMELRSGMRTADSLRDNQSYFYAELDRLKSIMDDLRTGKPLLILLDEILKGTNSADKQAGSFALVKQLLDYSCLVLIATHDLALGDLEKSYPGRIVNYSFEPNIEDDQLSFDYKLKPGLATKMNATFLMRKMGIIASLPPGSSPTL